MKKRQTPRGQNQFQLSWLSTYDWVKKKSSTHVTCTVCNTDLSFANMGETALKRHAQPNPTNPTRHQNEENKRTKLRKSLSVLHYVDLSKSQSPSTTPSASTSDADNSQTSSSSSKSDTPDSTVGSSTSTSTSLQPTLEMYATPLAITMAEIRWTMKVVLSHFSFRSCLDLGELFQCMFPDSGLTKAFSLSKTKCAYYINFGLAPFFKEQLMYDINKSPFYTVLFDESMNKILQTEQMDLHARYWCEQENQVKTKYYDSQFFRRPNADNIVASIDNALKDISKTELIHIGMDGPTTNWSVYDKIQESRKEKELPVLANLGRCGLHSVSGALGTGVTKSSWPLKKVMKSLFNLFHDSTARRDLYIMINESKVFALRFCPTRWVENEPVAERAVQVWDPVLKVIQHYATNVVPSKRPKDNSSYDTLVKYQSDITMKVKLQVFKDIAHKTNMFLTAFQTDGPMVPFLADSLEEIFRCLMGYFISKTVLKGAVTKLSLVKLDVSVEGGKCLLPGEVRMPTASKSMLKKLALSADAKASFMKEYRNLLIGMVQKLQERSPLKYAIVRCAASFDPVKMAEYPAEASTLFGGLVDALFDQKRITCREGDDVKLQYENFLVSVVRPNTDIFSKFDFTKQRLDVFLTVYLLGEKKYALLFKVFKFVCVLSHGQASIERGFNINKEVLVENLQQESLVSQRIVYDQLRSYDVKIHEIPITRQMILSCKAAHSKYIRSLEDKQKESADDEKSKKRKLKQEEVMSVKRRKTDVENAVKSLKKDIDNCSIEALTKEDFESMKLCLEKATSLRGVLKTKEETVAELEKAIGNLEKDLKNC